VVLAACLDVLAALVVLVVVMDVSLIYVLHAYHAVHAYHVVHVAHVAHVRIALAKLVVLATHAILKIQKFLKIYLKVYCAVVKKDPQVEQEQAQVEWVQQQLHLVSYAALQICYITNPAILIKVV
jgi:hypothetical protein